MADITMCSGKNCNKKDECYRHTATSNTFYQSYFITPPIKLDGTCDEFWDNKEWKT